MAQAEILSGLIKAVHDASGGRPGWIVCLIGSLGDVLLTASLLPAFRQKHGGRLTLVHSPTHSALLPALGVQADTFIPTDVNELAHRCYERIVTTSDLFAPGLPIFGLPSFNGNMARATVAGELKVMHNYREFLRLPASAPMAPVRSPSTLARPASSQRRVLLSPLTQTNPPASRAWWGAVAKGLRAAGVKVTVNLSGAKKPEVEKQAFPDCELRAVSIDELLQTLDHYDAYLNHPTGLGLLLGLAPGRAAEIWIVNYDPTQPEFFVPVQGIHHVNAMQDFVYQGTDAHRPIYQLNAFEQSGEDVAKIVLDAMDELPPVEGAAA